MTIWHGLYALKGTPKERIAILQSALQKALNDPTVVARFKAVGTTTYPADECSPEAHKERFLAEIDRIAALMRAPAWKGSGQRAEGCGER